MTNQNKLSPSNEQSIENIDVTTCCDKTIKFKVGDIVRSKKDKTVCVIGGFLKYQIINHQTGWFYAKASESHAFYGVLNDYEKINYNECEKKYICVIRQVLNECRSYI